MSGDFWQRASEAEGARNACLSGHHPLLSPRPLAHRNARPIAAITSASQPVTRGRVGKASRARARLLPFAPAASTRALSLARRAPRCTSHASCASGHRQSPSLRRALSRMALRDINDFDKEEFDKVLRARGPQLDSWSPALSAARAAAASSRHSRRTRCLRGVSPIAACAPPQTASMSWSVGAGRLSCG